VEDPRRSVDGGREGGRRGGALREHGLGRRGGLRKRLVEETRRTQVAVDDCYRRRARRGRAGLNIEHMKDRPLSKGKKDKLSEKLGDGAGARAKMRREIEDMSVGELEAEIKESRNISSRKRAGKAECLPLTLAILCLMGSPIKTFTTAYDCSNRSLK
jgi:hypothetical protein